jgi:hypothetical protein
MAIKDQVQRSGLYRELDIFEFDKKVSSGALFHGSEQKRRHQVQSIRHNIKKCLNKQLTHRQHNQPNPRPGKQLLLADDNYRASD